MATKNFIWFLPEHPTFLDLWSIKNALNDVLDRPQYGQEDNRFYIIEDDEDSWRMKMKRIKSLFDFYKSNKFNILFSSKEKMERAKTFLEQSLINYNQSIDSNELIVHCLEIKQRELIKNIKEHVRRQQTKRVVI